MTSFSERRLAAILATDVVGFSKLVSQSEVSTLAALQELRTRLIHPLVASRSGRLFKLVGDGALYEFPSVVQAVEAAVAFQDAMAAEAGAIRFRIGIHLGDVIPDGDDLLGDGVNIAVRIEAAAPTGGVALSDDAHRQVRDRLLLNWSDGGEQSLKNISRAMRVWYWSPDEAPLPENSVLSVAEAVKPSIAVLPCRDIPRCASHPVPALFLFARRPPTCGASRALCACATF